MKTLNGSQMYVSISRGIPIPPYEATVKPIIEQGLSELDTYVGQAWAAASDVTHFLRWKVSGFEWDLEGD